MTLKWISFREALSQTLASLTVSLPTPSRLGEYAAKAYYYPSAQRKKIVFLNGIGNLAQMSITCVMGIFGLIIYGNTFPIDIHIEWLVGFMLCMTVLILLIIYLKRKFSIFRFLGMPILKKYFQKLSWRDKLSTLGFSLGRYLIFSTQFYLILLFLGAEIQLLEGLAIIYIMYLVVSVLPMFPFLDIVVKGSAAVWLFQSIGVDEYTVLATTLGVWVLNLVIPSIFGSFQLIKAPN